MDAILTKPIGKNKENAAIFLIKYRKENKDLGPLYDENGSLEMREEIDNFYTYLDDEDSEDNTNDFYD